jgi:hypothetical protein
MAENEWQPLTLQYPSMREELLDTLKGLSDYEYQVRAWIEHHLPPGQFDDLDLAVHFLYDDTGLAEDPKGAIGVFLYDETEVALVSQVIDALNLVFEKYGLDKTDAEYINSDLWSEVLKTASIAFQELNSR